LKVTIDGTYYDFKNLMPPGDGWIPVHEDRYIYDFSSDIRATARFERGAEVFTYNVIFFFFWANRTGYGVGAMWFRAGTDNNNYLVDYNSGEIGYLHTTSPVPIPPALYLFGSDLLGLVGIARRKRLNIRKC